jgi:hypothetical protein
MNWHQWYQRCWFPILGQLIAAMRNLQIDEGESNLVNGVLDGNSLVKLFEARIRIKETV